VSTIWNAPVSSVALLFAASRAVARSFACGTIAAGTAQR
jgi:hypothetical protein